MPIHLPPISRRRFIRATVAAAGGLTLHSKLQAAGPGPAEQSWALLSDPHLAADRSLLCRGVNMTRHFEIVSHELIQLGTVPEGILMTGDCAYNTGEIADYSLLTELLKPLRLHGMPIHLTLGNHDNRQRFWDVFQKEKAAARPVADRQAAMLPQGLFNWYVLDSLETTQSTPGLLGPEQLHWLAKALDENPHTPALVALHHNPGLNGGNLGLKDTLALLEVLRPRRQVKAYIYGHTHNWKVETEASGIHLVNLPPVSYVFRDGEPSGWVHATIGATSMQLELRSVDPTHKAHGQKVRLAWRT